MYIGEETAKRIKLRAKELKIPLKSMLSDLQLGVNFISQISNGQNIGIQSLDRIADYLNCSVDYLLGKEEQKKDTPTEEDLNEGEKMLLDLFRSIPEADQPLVLSMIRAASNNQK